MKITKRFLMLLLALCLCFGLMTVTASAASGSCGENLTWSLENGTLTISGTGEMNYYDYWDQAPWLSHADSIKSVVIESGVTSLCDYAFMDCTNLSSVSLPDTLTFIGYNAFCRTSLTEVTVPASVTELQGGTFYGCEKLKSATILCKVLGGYAFENCTSLTSVKLTEGLEEIGYYTFGGCTALKSITIPSTVTYIDERAFSGCTALESIKIPAAVSYIDSSAFFNCTSLKKFVVASGNTAFCTDKSGVLYNHDKTQLIKAPGALSGSYTVPNTVTEIGAAAFAGCVNMTSVTLPEGITVLAYDVFSGCTSLENVNIPSTVTQIEWSAFYGCESLKNVTIPESVESIDSHAFACTGLNSITIPASVTYLDGYAFYGCTNLTKITVASDNPNYSSDSKGVLYNKDKTTLVKVPGAFSGSYTVPNTVTELAWSAFVGCGKVTDLTIPGGVEAVHGFWGCTALKTVTLKEGVKMLDYGAFQECTSLETVNIPASVNDIYFDSFDKCPKLDGINVASGSQYFCTDENGILYTKDMTEILFVPMSLSGDFTVPATVTNIYEAFAGSQITSITLPGTITETSGWTFKDCTKLESVTVGSGVTRLAYGAFLGCTSLTDVDLPDTLISLAWDTFGGCTSLKTITIPASVQNIDWAVFSGSKNLKNVVFTGNAPNISSDSEGAFYGIKATAWYPAGNATWTKDVRQNYGGKISWVSYKDLAIKTQPVAQKVKAGTTVKFSVKVSGAAPTYQWQYRTGPKAQWQNATGTGNKTSVLKVAATAARSGYQYRCVITDGMGNTVTTKAVYLYVLGVKTQPTAKNVKAGVTAKFTVAASGHNKTYQWQYKNASGKWVNATGNGAKTATLKVTARVALSGRMYRCVIKDSAGNQVISKAVKLTVFGIKTQPTAKSVKAGTTAKFTVAATGAGLKYQWQYKNANGKWVNVTATGAKTAALKVAAKASFNGRLYRCRITDSLGRVIFTNAVKLTVK